MEKRESSIQKASSALSAEEKARIIGLYGESGLTHVEFWRREGVSLFNFQRWLGKRKRTGEAHFVEVESRAIAERGRYRMGVEGGGTSRTALSRLEMTRSKRSGDTR